MSGIVFSTIIITIAHLSQINSYISQCNQFFQYLGAEHIFHLWPKLLFIKHSFLQDRGKLQSNSKQVQVIFISASACGTLIQFFTYLGRVYSRDNSLVQVLGLQCILNVWQEQCPHSRQASAWFGNHGRCYTHVPSHIKS